MTDTRRIISFLDQFLEESCREYLTPIEANKLLEQMRLLPDDKRKPGKPLRDLLRSGKLPHAEQPGGKYKGWRIPHSSFWKQDKRQENAHNVSRIKKVNKLEDELEIDLEVWKDELRAAREKYRPKRVKCLFIAEAPPEDRTRFFYYPCVKTADYLFLGIMKVLYPGEIEQYLTCERPRDLKEKMLRRFQQDGFYLEDLFDVPKSLYKGRIEEMLSALICRIGGIVSGDTPIILIKTTVFDTIARQLEEAGFNGMIRRRISFPIPLRERDFNRAFSEAMESAHAKM